MSSSEILITNLSSGKNSTIGSTKSFTKEDGNIAPFGEFLAQGNPSAEKNVTAKSPHKEPYDGDEEVSKPLIVEEITIAETTASVLIPPAPSSEISVQIITDTFESLEEPLEITLQADPIEVVLEDNTPHIKNIDLQAAQKLPTDSLVPENRTTDKETPAPEALDLADKIPETAPVLPLEESSHNMYALTPKEPDKQFSSFASDSLQPKLESQFERAILSETSPVALKIDDLAATKQESDSTKQPSVLIPSNSGDNTKVEVTTEAIITALPSLPDDSRQKEAVAPLITSSITADSETIDGISKISKVESTQENIVKVKEVITSEASKIIISSNSSTIISDKIEPQKLPIPNDIGGLVTELPTLEESSTEFDLSEIAIIDNSQQKTEISFKSNSLMVFNKASGNYNFHPQEQVALVVKYATSHDKNEVRINLYPESLGTIDIKIEFSNNDFNERIVEKITITPERLSTLKLLEGSKSQLEASFSEQKKSITTIVTESSKKDASLEFDMRGGNNSGNQNGYFESFEERENWINRFRDFVKTNEDSLMQTSQTIEHIPTDQIYGYSSLHFINMEV